MILRCTVIIYNKRVRGAPKGGLRTQETRLATALIKFRNKERNVRLPTEGKCVRRAKKCNTSNLSYIIVSIL